MFGSVKNYLVKTLLIGFVKTLLIGFVKKKLVSIVDDLPDAEQEVITAVLIDILEHIISKLPSLTEYLEPIIDALKDMPLGKIASGGVVDQAVGQFKQAFDWVVNLTKGKTSTELAAENQKALSNIG